MRGPVRLQRTLIFWETILPGGNCMSFTGCSNSAYVPEMCDSGRFASAAWVSGCWLCHRKDYSICLIVCGRINKSKKNTPNNLHVPVTPLFALWINKFSHPPGEVGIIFVLMLKSKLEKWSNFSKINEKQVSVPIGWLKPGNLGPELGIFNCLNAAYKVLSIQCRYTVHCIQPWDSNTAASDIVCYHYNFFPIHL